MILSGSSWLCASVDLQYITDSNLAAFGSQRAEQVPAINHND